MRLVLIILCLSIQTAFGQFITRDYSLPDTTYFLNATPIVDKYFEDNNYYIDFSKLEAPCYITELTEFKKGRVEVTFNGLSHSYSNNIDKLCMAETVMPDWYGHGQTMEIEWDEGYCDRFLKTPSNRMREHESKFTAKFRQVDENSPLLKTIQNFDYAKIRGHISSRYVPVGKRSLTTIGFTGVVDLFRIDEKIIVDEVLVYSKKGTKRQLVGYEKSQNFRELTKRRFELLDAETGKPRLYINIKDFQKTIIESIWPAIDQKPKDMLACAIVGQQEVFLYPNPSFGRINLKFDQFQNGDYTFSVYNIIGKPIFSKSFSIDGNNEIINLNLEQLKKGTYLYSISNSEGKRLVTRRLSIVQH